MFDLLNPMNENRDLMRDLFGMTNQNNGLLKTDVTESDKGYEVKVDAPGFDKKDLKINYQDNVLKINGHRDTISDHSDKNGNIIASERSYGSVSRQYRLPNVDRDEIKASYKNGVLSITLPKLQVDQKSDSQIEID